jgi:hypothetical protein
VLLPRAARVGHVCPEPLQAERAAAVHRHARAVALGQARRLVCSGVGEACGGVCGPSAGGSWGRAHGVWHSTAEGLAAQAATRSGMHKVT